jgi:hypothetical protein
VYSKEIFSPPYLQDYLDGFENGRNPFLVIDRDKNTLAYIFGFNSGRMDYEEMNGKISDGIPNRIVTIKVLEEFLLAGLLGLGIEDEDTYTLHQQTVISKWYQSGVEKYDPYQSTDLSEILENNGIQMC